MLLDPTGATAWDYHKAHPTPRENIMVVAGPHTFYLQGRLRGAVCGVVALIVLGIAGQSLCSYLVLCRFTPRYSFR